MGGWNKIPDKQVQIWKDMRANGMKIAEIAEKTGFHRDTIYRRLGSDGKTITSRKSPVKITEQMVDDMKIYRELGMSNSQIAIEMGLAKVTVNRHLGPQHECDRAQYGSLVAHVTGESYVPKGYDLQKAREEKKMEKLEAAKTGETQVSKQSENTGLKVASFQLVLNGSKATYTISNGTIRCDLLGSSMDIPMTELDSLINELEELKELVKSSLFSIDLA